MSRVAEDRKRVVCPVIDIISDETFAYIRSFELHWGAFNWDLHFRWYTRTTSELTKGRQDFTQAFRTPAMAGGLFAMDKSYFFELGGYDEKMEVWGGENLELSFRVRYVLLCSIIFWSQNLTNLFSLLHRCGSVVVVSK